MKAKTEQRGAAFVRGLILVAVLACGPAWAQIEISSIEDLQRIGHDPAYPLDGHYVLTQDIDASATADWNDGAGFDPIGTYDLHAPSAAFTGAFDGQGHVISGVTIHRPDRDHVGLFGCLGQDAEVHNVGLEGGSTTGDWEVGGIAGCNEGTVSDCYATGTVTGDYAVGGLLGKNEATVLNSHATGGVSGRCSIGGLAASNLGVVSSSYATGTVTGGDDIGGLVAYNYETVSNSYATGAVRGHDEVGGLVAYNYGTIVNSYAMGAVTGDSYVGGLVGYSKGTVSDSYASGRVKGNKYVGGLVGRSSYDGVTASFWDLETTGQSGWGNGTGRTTAEMIQQVTFADAGWDFDSIWAIVENTMYPHLRGVGPDPGADSCVLTVNVQGNGSVSLAPEGGYYPAWTLVTLTAQGQEGQEFAYWMGDGLPAYGLAQNPLVLAMGKDRSVTAVFMEATIGIASIEELQQIGRDISRPVSWSYALVRDIDASATHDWNDGAGFDPITGRFFDTLVPFTGTFDGQGHRILGLTIDRPREDDVGLFRCVEQQGEVRNVGIEDCAVNGDCDVGGVVGYNLGTVLHSYAFGLVTGYDFVGGVVGYNLGTVSSSYAGAAVSGHESVGGVVGCTSGTVSDNYAMGPVTGDYRVGGLVGQNLSALSNSYATGPVRGDSSVGGLVGVNFQGTVTASFWDTETTGQSSSGGGTGKPTAEMIQEATFADAGWDFDSVWGIIENTTYPYLRGIGPDPEYDVHTLTLDVQGNGSVFLAPEADSYVAWTVVMLTANAQEGNQLVYWVVDGSPIYEPVQNPLTLAMGRDRNVTAVFLPPSVDIASIEDLQRIGRDIRYPLHWSYTLSHDIDASATAGWGGGAGFEPIGTYVRYNAWASFAGIFDGQSHAISHLMIDRPNERYVGLFGCVGSDGEVRNIGLEGAGVTGHWDVGGLVGRNQGTVSECCVTGAVDGDGEVGGLVGWNEGTTSRCYATGTVNGLDYVGGLIGYNDRDVSGSSAANAVTGDYAVGGLVGYNDGTTFGCCATGTVNGNEYVGGLIGYNYWDVSNSCARGTVTGHYSVGGLIGINEMTVSECYAAGTVDGDYSAGGLVGYNCVPSEEGETCDGSVTASFWDIQTSGQSWSDGGTGRTTLHMMQLATFTDAGWDFDSIWDIHEGISYPYLRTCPQAAPYHTGDQNGDNQISLSELLRVIQFYNSDGYHCEGSTEDGYAPGQGDTACITHASDYNPQDWYINLSELLRFVQFYSSGGCHVCAEGEDGFCAGPPP